MRSLFPKRKSRLTEQAKAVAAEQVVLDVCNERLDAAAADLRLSEAIGLQYLSDTSAIADITALPADWEEGGRARSDLLSAIFRAATSLQTCDPTSRRRALASWPAT